MMLAELTACKGASQASPYTAFIDPSRPCPTTITNSTNTSTIITYRDTSHTQLLCLVSAC